MYRSRIAFIPVGEFSVPDFASDLRAEALSVALTSDSDLDRLEFVQDFLGISLLLLHLSSQIDEVDVLLCQSFIHCEMM